MWAQAWQTATGDTERESLPLVLACERLHCVWIQNHVSASHNGSWGFSHMISELFTYQEKTTLHPCCHIYSDKAQWSRSMHTEQKTLWFKRNTKCANHKRGGRSLKGLWGEKAMYSGWFLTVGTMSKQSCSQSPKRDWQRTFSVIMNFSFCQGSWRQHIKTNPNSEEER